MVTGTNTSGMAANGVVPTSSSVEATSPTRRTSDNRRSNKPIMEKRRRARINNCLNELKSLILDAMKKDPARHSKLEKADILEMTVKHLQNLQRQQAAMSAATDPSVMGKFRAGFSECATEVGRFPGLEPTVRRRLLQHLANCLNQAKPEVPQVQVHVVPSLPHGGEQPSTTVPTPVPAVQPNSIILSNGNGASLHLVPTRLPNGDIALVLPTTTTAAPSPLPLLVPIPTRTASNASASSSSSSNCSSGHGGDSVEYNSPPMQKPLSLVVGKKCEEPHEDDKPWRPW